MNKITTFIFVCAILILHSCSNKFRLSETIKNIKQEVLLNDAVKADKAITLLCNSAKKAKPSLADSIISLHLKQKQTISFIEKVDSLLRNMEGVSDIVTGDVIKKEETVLNYAFFFGTPQNFDGECVDKNAYAAQLKRKINAFYFWTIQNYNEGKLKSKKWQEKDMLLKNSQSGNCWERFTFEGPLIANLAMLQVLKADIYEREWLLIQDYAYRLEKRL